MSKKMFSFRARAEKGIARHIDASSVVGTSNFWLVRSEHAYASYLGLFFRPPGFSPYVGWEERRVQGLDYKDMSVLRTECHNLLVTTLWKNSIIRLGEFELGKLDLVKLVNFFQILSFAFDFVFLFIDFREFASLQSCKWLFDCRSKIFHKDCDDKDGLRPNHLFLCGQRSAFLIFVPRLFYKIQNGGDSDRTRVKPKDK